MKPADHRWDRERIAAWVAGACGAQGDNSAPAAGAGAKDSWRVESAR
jgi:hypothetical protein